MRVIIAAVVGLAAAPAAAAAETACAPYEAIAKRLASEYQEQPAGRGLDNRSGVLLEIWTSEETGTWTALLVRPDGTACMAQAGEGWDPVAKPEPVGDPA